MSKLNAKKKIKKITRKIATLTAAAMMTLAGIGTSAVVPVAATSATVHFGGYAQWPKGGSKTGRFSINGTPALCYQHALKSPKNVSASYVGENNSALFRKILYYGFNGPDPTYWGSRRGSTSDKARVLTTRALSMAYSGKVPDHNYNNDTRTDSAAKAFYYWAKAKPDPKNGWIVFSTTAPSVSLDRKTNVQKSQTIIAKKAGTRAQRFSGKLDTGNANVMIVNETSGKTGKSVIIRQDDRFHLQAAASYTGSINLPNINIGGGGTYTAQNWKTASGKQNVTYLTFTFKQNATSLKATFKGTIPVSISKKDITGTTEIKGAKMRLTDAAGKSVDEWTSNGTDHIIKGLTQGSKYVLTEIQAPGGYEIASSIEFVADKPGKLIVMKDERKKTQLRIRKTGTENASRPAPGNTYRLTGKTKAGKTYTDEKITDENGYATFTLEAGSYVMKEVAFSDDYYQDAAEYKVNVSDDLKVTVNGKAVSAAQNYALKDKERWHTDIILGKKDISTLVPLGGATYRLAGISEEKNKVELYATSDANGTISFKNIETGTYDLTETEAPKNYHCLTRKLKVIVSHKSGDSNAKAVISDPDKKETDEDAVSGTTLYDTGLYAFKIRKKDARTGNSLKGASFTLKGTSSFDKQIIMTVQTEEGGFAGFTNLEPGTYQLTEVSAPKGYHPDSSHHWVSISYKGKITSDLDQSDTNASYFYTLENMPSASREIPVRKQWKDQNDTKRKLPVIHLKAKGSSAKKISISSLLRRGPSDSLRDSLLKTPKKAKSYHINTAATITINGITIKHGDKITTNGYVSDADGDNRRQSGTKSWYFVGVYTGKRGSYSTVAVGRRNANAGDQGMSYMRQADIIVNTKYSLTLNANGGTFTNHKGNTWTNPDNGASLYYGSGNYDKIQDKFKPSKNGYSLEGWYDSASGGTKVYNSNGTIIKNTKYWNGSGKYCHAGNMTVYAHWKQSAANYTIRDVFVDANNKERALLGTIAKNGAIGSTVSGAVAGCDTSPDKYHQGYAYTGATKTNVTASGKAIVYRYFVAVTKIIADDPGATFETSVNDGEWKQHTNTQTEKLPYGASVRIRDLKAKNASGYVIAGIKEDDKEIGDFQGIYSMTVDKGGKIMKINLEKDPRSALLQDYVTTEGVSWQKLANEDEQFTIPTDTAIAYGTDSAYVSKKLKAGTYQANAKGLSVSQPSSSSTRQVIAKMPNWIDRNLSKGKTGTMKVGDYTYITHDVSWIDTSSKQHFDTDKYGNIPGYWEKIDDHTYQYTFKVYDDDTDWNVYEEKVDEYSGNYVEESPYTLASGSADIPVITNTLNGKYGAFSIKKITQQTNGSEYETDDEFSFKAVLTDENGKAVKGTATYGDTVFSDGINRFTLKRNEIKTFNGVPVNWHYRVEEEKNAKYPLTQVNGKIGAVAEGKIVAEKEALIVYMNKLAAKEKLYEATVSKQLASGSKDNDQQYSFHAHISNMKILDPENEPQADGKKLDIQADGTTDLTFGLKASQSLRFKNLNQEAEISITEEGGNYISSYVIKKNEKAVEKGEQNGINNQLTAGSVKMNDNLHFIFTNRPESYQKLTVEKKIDGGESEKEFKMTAEFNGLATRDRIKTGSETLLPDNNGQISYSFVLKAGERKEFTNIPSGIKYKVTEAAEEQYAPSYKLISKGGSAAKASESASAQHSLATASEQIEADSEDTLTFTNTFAYSLGIKKQNEKKEPLSHVEFSLRKFTVNSNKNVSAEAGQKATTNSNGFAGWTGLKEGLYILSETKTPSGYTAVASRIIKIASDGTVRVMVQPAKSASLQNAERALAEASDKADEKNKEIIELQDDLKAAQQYAELLKKAARAKESGSSGAKEFINKLVSLSSDADAMDYQNATVAELANMAAEANKSIAVIQQEVSAKTSEYSAAKKEKDDAQQAYDKMKKEEDEKGAEIMTVADIANGIIPEKAMEEWLPETTINVGSIAYRQFVITDEKLQKLPATGRSKSSVMSLAFASLTAILATLFVIAARRKADK